MSMLGQMLPTSVKRQLKRSLPYYRRFYCPICNTWDRDFQTFGLVPRPNARCPTCRSLERHRLVWCFFSRHTDLFRRPRKKMLHFAAEEMMSSRLSQLDHLEHITADLLEPAMVKVDITDIQFADQTFDVVYCSHVLEHVSDDRKAMRECRRILKQSGWAVFVVPLFAEATTEDPSITDPKERERLFGQWDHVRRYGPDFEERLKQAGFAVVRYSADEIVGAERERLAIRRGEGPVFFCRRTD
jgi:SAM-dependent methyltransferase